MAHLLNLKLTKRQILRIINHEPFTISHKHFGHGRHEILLNPYNYNKVVKANNRKGTTKITLDDDETKKTLEGNGLGHFFKSLGRKIEHTANDAGHAIVSTANEYGPSVGTHIASTLIHQGIPGVASVLGDVAGGPIGGIAGGLAGYELSQQIGKSTGYGMKQKTKAKKDGKGLFKALHKIGISRNQVKSVGKVIANQAIDAIGATATAYTGVPMTPFTESLKSATDKAIDDENHRGITRAIKSNGKLLAEEQIQKQIQKLPIEIQPLAEQKVVQMGFGLKHGNAKIKKKYIANPNATFSNILLNNNPAMHPFIPEYNPNLTAIKGTGLPHFNVYDQFHSKYKGKGLILIICLVKTQIYFISYLYYIT
jgi:hypothetical protein